MLVSYRQQKTCTGNCNLIYPDEYASTAHLYVLIHWEQKRKIEITPFTYMQKTLKTSEILLKKERQDYYTWVFSVTKWRKLIINVGWKVEGETFVKGLAFIYLGRRELGKSEEKRLNCIPNILSHVLTVSKKSRTKELEKKNVKQEERVWRMKATLVSMQNHL